MNSKRLWAPWRLAYIVRAGKSDRQGCILCRIRRGPDAKRYILERGKVCFTVLNLFPYNNGHLLVVPYRHIGRLEALTQEEWLEILRLARGAMRRFKETIFPHGYNLGINLGRAAGAGIPGHLHLHLVPRWQGDTNFMSVVSDSRVVSQSLESAWRLLKKQPSPQSSRRHAAPKRR